MSPTDRSFDTNILFYAFDHTDSRKQQVAERVAVACYAGRSPLPLQVLTEFYRSAVKKPDLAALAASIIEEYMRGMTIQVALQEDLIAAIRLHTTYKLQLFD